MDTRLEVGAQVPGTPYQLLACAGEGAFGQVWKAIHPTRKKLYALKFCKEWLDLDTLRNETKHFDRMPEACREGFVFLYEIHDEEDRDLPFVAYEFVEGEDFEKHIQRRFTETGCFSPSEAAEIIYDLATIMARVHTLKDPIVHRDLKPSNILVIKSGLPWKFKIADFGLGVLAITSTRARQLTVSDEGRDISMAGTRCYMSVEQRDPMHVGHPSDDVHALGVIWYQLLRGAPGDAPFRRKDGVSDRWDPPSHDPGFDWTALRTDLLGRGLTQVQAELLESCLKRHKFRPKHGGELAQEIRKLFPPLQEVMKKDIIELTRLQFSGCDIKVYLQDVANDRLTVWKVAADAGDAEACWVVSLILRARIYNWKIKKGISRWKVKKGASRRLLRIASEKGFANAQYDLGVCYQRLKAEDRAVFWYVAAASQKHPVALCELGEILLGITFDCQTISFQNKEDADKYRTKVMKLWTNTHKDSQQQGIEFIEQAASLGSAKAQILLSQLYTKGVFGFQQDMSKASKWLCLAAQEDNWLGSSWQAQSSLAAVLFGVFQTNKDKRGDDRFLIDAAILWAERAKATYDEDLWIGRPRPIAIELALAINTMRECRRQLKQQ